MLITLNQKIYFEMITIKESELTGPDASIEINEQAFSPIITSGSTGEVFPQEEAKDHLFSYLVRTLDEKDKVDEARICPKGNSMKQISHVEPPIHEMTQMVDWAAMQMG